MNKSLITNIVSLTFIGAGFSSPIFSEELKSIGFFSFSGAITNWLAIHMLFEKVPGLYGSGVIPSRFKEFKEGIKELIMGEFFTEENIQKFFSQSSPNHGPVDLSPVVKSIDLDHIFNELLKIVESSQLGGMLGMFGGPAILEGMRPAFVDKMSVTLEGMTKEESFQESIKKTLSQNISSGDLLESIESVIDKRLDELTPKLVKEIIQKMIKKHLGWLVVWGGVFGGIIGFIMGFTS